MYSINVWVASFDLWELRGSLCVFAHLEHFEHLGMERTAVICLFAPDHESSRHSFSNDDWALGGAAHREGRPKQKLHFHFLLRYTVTDRLKQIFLDEYMTML